MKSTLKYTVIAAVALLAASCTIDYVEPDQNLLPQASELTPKITVDQETNMVTFEVENTGVVPLWIFGEEKIDGKASKKYAYAQNGVTLRIRDAGQHSVELKAYNANGISQGSQIVTFSLDNTYRDPFDATPYMKAIANTWAWDSANAGHFGCGPSIETNTPEQTSVTADNWGKSWWSAGANEKADWSLYDDTMTFTADGQYTYNPGDGQVFVNYSSGYKSEYLITDAVDYVAPIDEFTCKYTIENNWNDAGIEEIFLVLPEGKNLSYIPNAYALQNPRYQFIETTTSKIKKNLLLVLDDHSSISWRYSFVPYVKQAGPEEILAGTTAEGKAWVMDAAAKGHLGCGETVDNPAGWWSAGAYEKEGSGMYDDVLTFYPDGTYTFSAGEDGLIYVNKDVTAIGSDINPHDGNDFSMPWDDQKSTYTFDGETLSFPAGVIIGYVPNDAMFNEPTFTVTEISEDKLVLVHVTSGICWQYIFRPRDLDVEPEPEPDSKAYFDIEGATNLWRSTNITMGYWYANSGWSPIDNPEFEWTDEAKKNCKIVLPAEVGGAEWQGQTIFKTEIPASASKTYDFCTTFHCTTACTITLKIAWLDNDADNFMVYDNAIAIPEDEDFVIKKESLVPNCDYDKVVVFFDFGRTAGGSVITLTDTCFQEHQEK